MSRLELDAERCTGHGRCYSLVPELFDTDDFGHGVVIPGVAIDPERARLAVLNCPENAIEFTELSAGADPNIKAAVQA